MQVRVQYQVSHTFICKHTENSILREHVEFVDVRWFFILVRIGKRIHRISIFRGSSYWTILLHLCYCIRNGETIMQIKIKKGFREFTINDWRQPARDGIPLLNVGLLAGIFSTSPYLMEWIRGVESSRYEFLKTVIH